MVGTVTDVAGSYSGQSGVDECIERIAESINLAHGRVDKVVTGKPAKCTCSATSSVVVSASSNYRLNC